MKLSQLKLVPMAAAIVMMGAAGSANAGAYGYSYLNVFNLFLSNTGPAPTNITSTNTTSTVAGLLNPNVTDAHTGSLDAAQAFVGGGTPVALIGPQNMFNQRTPNPAAPPFETYARSDVQIVSTQFPQGTGNDTAQAVGVAEAHVADANTATATARIGSTTGLTFTETVGAGTQITFSFLADRYLRAFLNPLAALGSDASANVTATITITNDAGGATVFSWAPDGDITTAPFGGTEGSDPISLNTGVAIHTPGSSILDTPGCGVPSSGVSTTPDPGITPGTGTSKLCGAAFSATTNPLLAGTYTIKLNLTDSVDLVKVIPEPGTIALLGLGLAGLGFASRRKPV